MRNISKLQLIKTIHTLIWLFFNVVILYLFYAVTAGNIDMWTWIGTKAGPGNQAYP